MLLGRVAVRYAPGCAEPDCVRMAAGRSFIAGSIRRCDGLRIAPILIADDTYSLPRPSL